MELLAGMLLSYIDSPVYVHNHCRTIKQQDADKDKDDNECTPCNFAPGGKPDIEIDYVSYKLLIEVSIYAKKCLSHYNDQLDSAINHAKKLRMSGYKNSIYVLLVNKNSLMDSEIKLTLKKKTKKLNDEDIYFVSLSLEEFSQMGETLGCLHKNEVGKLSTEKFEWLLKQASDGALQKKTVRLDKLLLQHFSNL